MRIAVNGFEAVVPRFGFEKSSGLPVRVGSGEFAFRLITEFAKEKTNSFVVYLPSLPTSDMPKEGPNFKYSVVRSKKFWTILALSKKLSEDKNKIDVFLSPTHYLPLTTHVPSAVSILDVSYLKFPELFTKKRSIQAKDLGRDIFKKSEKNSNNK